MADGPAMRCSVVLLPMLLVLLGACGRHQQTVECSRSFSGMRKAFERYDTNNDGLISRQEYHAVIAHLLESGDGSAGRREDPDKDDQDFDSLDRNHDGYLSFDEFTGTKCKDGH